MNTVTVTIDDLFKVYFWGMSEGQLLMEEERENEELFDAAVCAARSRKLCIPTVPARRRQVHSKKWFEAMQQARQEFRDFVKRKAEETS
jgi:acyl-CoA reductase-like NAD-dependent aldehyde dehydrogenase